MTDSEVKSSVTFDAERKLDTYRKELAHARRALRNAQDRIERLETLCKEGQAHLDFLYKLYKATNFSKGVWDSWAFGPPDSVLLDEAESSHCPPGAGCSDC